MEHFHSSIPEFHAQLKIGKIQKAFRGIINYMMALKTHLKSKYPSFSTSSNLYIGTMDMTYFSFTPTHFSDMGLKFAVVFSYSTFRFEVWLSAVNKKVQKQYWKQIKELEHEPYHIVPTIQGYDSILECILVDQPDFVDLDQLTLEIERGTIKFIDDIDRILKK
jgi:hypothetical protein